MKVVVTPTEFHVHPVPVLLERLELAKKRNLCLLHCLVEELMVH
jgi:hypothetical protein